jgi:hypothetical protein
MGTRIIIDLIETADDKIDAFNKLLNNFTEISIYTFIIDNLSTETKEIITSNNDIIYKAIESYDIEHIKPILKLYRYSYDNYSIHMILSLSKLSPENIICAFMHLELMSVNINYKMFDMNIFIGNVMNNVCKSKLDIYVYQMINLFNYIHTLIPITMYNVISILLSVAPVHMSECPLLVTRLTLEVLRFARTNNMYMDSDSWSMIKSYKAEAGKDIGLYDYIYTLGYGNAYI